MNRRLERILEPEVMDSPQDAQDYDSMDHSAVNRAFASDFLAKWSGLNPVIDFGTGTAQIPIETCKQNEKIEIIGIDLAEHMLHIGRANVTRAGLSSRIRLQACDAKSSPFADGAFGAVISNSIIHHIPDPQSVFAEIVRLARPGGIVFVRDLLRPADMAALNQLVEHYAGEANQHQRKLFADSLHAALTVDEVRCLVGKLNCPITTVEQSSDRHWTWIMMIPN